MIYGPYEFNLNDNFTSKFKGKQPEFGPLGYFTYKRTYARELPNGKTEEFWQTIKRVVEGCFLIQKHHCMENHIPWSERKAQKSAQEMFQRMWDFKFLPPGRGLWAMGTDFVFKKGSAALNNCGFVSTADLKTDFSGPFIWLMDMSMHGVGVGFDTAGAAADVALRRPRIASDKHVVEDSREGWVEACRRVLDAYVGKDSLPDHWDFTGIREAGTTIKGFGGIAPGAGPLMTLIESITKYLDSYVAAEAVIDSTAIVDLMNFIGAAVVSGGIRRSSEIALGQMNDTEFQDLKIPDENGIKYSRWASNNSLIAKHGDDYSIPATRSALNGEPGYFWIENARQFGRMADPRNDKDYRVAGVNPCGEQSLEPYELCNLVETFPVKHDTLDDYLRTLKFAYLYAKSVTLLPTHDKRTNAVMLRNRRIGTSQSGIIDQINKIGHRAHMEWCNKGYEVINSWDRVYSEWLCVSQSIKKTTVKPSGTVSLLVGVNPGIHHPHARFHLRRIRVAKNSNLWKVMEKAGYPVEPDMNEPDYTMIVSFPVEEKFFSRKKEDVSMWEQFELAAQMQHYWSDNQVSITITVKPEEAKDLATALSMYETRLKSVSFLPIDGGSYKQAPYEEISEETYKELSSKLKKVRLDLHEEDTGKVIERFCDGDSCVL